MTPLKVTRLRMQNARLVGARFAKPEDVVHWFGAVQAQDYAGAKWAIAQRVQSCSDADVEQAFQSGKILRTHVMRPTWHFVTPADIRWMLGLTAPRVNAANAPYYRKLELHEDTFQRSREVLTRALSGGEQRTRAEMARTLEDAGIRASGLRLSYLMMRAELDAVICSGARRGKQFTYALLGARPSGTQAPTREEALAELTKRYFQSHGPSLPRDFAWWSGLSVSDAKLGIELAKGHLASDVAEGKTYWFAPSRSTARPKNPIIHLLPNYDEYLIAHKDRSVSFDARLVRARRFRDNVLANHIIVLNGKVVGGWRRTIEKNAVTIQATLLTRLDRAEGNALQQAAEQYGRALDLPVRWAPKRPTNPPGRA
jgi:hypothetical protein